MPRPAWRPPRPRAPAATILAVGFSVQRPSRSCTRDGLRNQAERNFISFRSPGEQRQAQKFATRRPGSMIAGCFMASVLAKFQPGFDEYPVIRLGGRRQGDIDWRSGGHQNKSAALLGLAHDLADLGTDFVGRAVAPGVSVRCFPRRIRLLPGIGASLRPGQCRHQAAVRRDPFRHSRFRESYQGPGRSGRGNAGAPCRRASESAASSSVTCGTMKR